MISVKLKDEARILNAFRKAPALFARELQKALEVTGIETESIVKEDVIERGLGMWKPPVDTRTMKKGIQMTEKRPMRVILTASSTTPYAKYVHDGTRKMKARPFFTITAERKKKAIQDIFSKKMAIIIDKIVKSI